MNIAIRISLYTSWGVMLGLAFIEFPYFYQYSIVVIVSTFIYMEYTTLQQQRQIIKLMANQMNISDWLKEVSDLQMSGRKFRNKVKNINNAKTRS